MCRKFLVWYLGPSTYSGHPHQTRALSLCSQAYAMHVLCGSTPQNLHGLDLTERAVEMARSAAGATLHTELVAQLRAHRVTRRLRAHVTRDRATWHSGCESATGHGDKRTTSGKRFGFSLRSLCAKQPTHARKACSRAGRQRAASKKGKLRHVIAEHRGARACIRIAAPADAERQGA